MTMRPLARDLASAQRLSVAAIVFLILVNVILLLVGMMLEPVSAILIMVPVLLPVVQAFGIDPLHFGIFMVLNLVIGLITPPVGLVLYVLSSVTNIEFQRVLKGVVPFLAPMIFITTFEKMPIALALAFFKGQGEALWPWLMAASVISMLPLMVVYLAAQRWFIEGLTFTGLKQ